MNPTIVKSFIAPADAQKGFMVTDAMKKSDFNMAHAESLGITCDAAALKALVDSNPAFAAEVKKVVTDAGFAFGEANIDALGQFFTIFNEQTINALYRGRTAVQTFGVKAMGDWTTERIVFKARELTAKASLYDDWSRGFLANYNYTYDVVDTLRMEWALEVTKLEEAVAAVMRRNAGADKKAAIDLNHNIWENEIFWNGASINGKRVYGVLNAPGLNGRSETLPIDMTASGLTTANVISALRTMKQEFIDDLQGNGDVDSMPIELACPIAWQTAFTIPNDYMITANKWLAENWKNLTVSFKPELTDRAIIFAKNVPEVGMDTINLTRTSALRLVGAIPTVKGREEAYSASIAGAFISCPFGVKVWLNGSDSAAGDDNTAGGGDNTAGGGSDPAGGGE